MSWLNRVLPDLRASPGYWARGILSVLILVIAVPISFALAVLKIAWEMSDVLLMWISGEG